jgi:hypothetical protein
MACYKVILKTDEGDYALLDVQNETDRIFDTREDAENAIKNLSYEIDKVSGETYFDIDKQIPINFHYVADFESPIPQTANLNELFNFFVHDFVYTMSFNNLTLGDLNISHSDSVNVVKRNGTQVTDGTSNGYGRSKYAVIRTTKRNIDGISTDVEDGQTYVNPFSTYSKYIRGQAKNNSDVRNIYYKKLIPGLKLSKAEKKILQDNSALLTDRKLGGRDHFTNIKTSFHTISRESTSTIINPSQNAFRLQELWQEAINLLENNQIEEYQNLVATKIHPLYKPLPHRKRRHELLNHMELNAYDFITVDSASKGMRDNIGYYENGYKTSPMYISDYMVREIVKTDSSPFAIPDGTQLQGLIYDEQNDNLVVKFTSNGKTVEAKLSKLLKDYDHIKEQRTKTRTNSLYKRLFKEDGTIRWEAISESILKQSNRAQVDANMASLFDLDADGNPIISFNNNLQIVELERALLNMLSTTLKERVNGKAYTLISSENSPVIEYNGQVVPTDKYIANQKFYDSKDITVRRLKYGQYDSKKNVYYSEVTVSSDVLEKLNTVVGATLEANNEMLLSLGVRIPTEEKNSMVIFKIVDTLPNHYTGTIMLPHEVILYSGADFDIDKLFSKHYNITNIGGIKYGSYYQGATQKDQLRRAFFEYANSELGISLKKQDKEIIARNKQLLEEFIFPDKQLQDLYNEREKLALDTKFSNSLEQYELEQKLKEYDVLINKELLTYSVLESNPDKYADFVKDYKDVVINNVKAYKEDGNLTKVIPLTPQEASNSLLDIEMVLAYNESTKERATYPNSLEIWKQVIIPKLRESGIITNEKQVEGITSIVDRTISQNNIDVGGDNIGVAATFNIIYRLFKKYNTHSVRMFGENRSFSGVDSVNIGDGKLGSRRITTDTGDVKVSAVVASIIAMMTDNAKEQLAKILGLDKNKLSQYLVGLALGFDPVFLGTLSIKLEEGKDPFVVAEPDTNLEYATNQILQMSAMGATPNAIEKQYRELEESGLSAAEIQKVKETQIKANVYIKKNFKTDKKTGVQYKSGFRHIRDAFANIKSINQVASDYSLEPDHIKLIYNTFFKQYNRHLSTIQRDLVKLNQIRSLLKGVDSESESLDKIQEALDYFGVIVTQSDVKIDTNLNEHYFILNDRYYYRPALNNPNAVEFGIVALKEIGGRPNRKYPLAKVIQDNLEIKSRLATAYITDQKLLSSALLKRNTVFRSLFAPESKRDINNRQTFGGYTVPRKRLPGLYRDFISKLLMTTSTYKMNKYLEQNGTDNEIGIRNEVFNNFNLIYKKSGNTILEQLKSKLEEGNSPYKDNKFLKSTFFTTGISQIAQDLTKVEYQTDTVSEMLPDYKQQIANDFLALSNARRKISADRQFFKNDVSDLTYDEAAYMMSIASEHYSLIANAHGYKLFSISTILPASILKNQFKFLNEVDALFREFNQESSVKSEEFNNKFKAITGLSLGEFMAEFFEAQGLTNNITFNVNSLNNKLKSLGAPEMVDEEFEFETADDVKDLSKYGFFDGSIVGDTHTYTALDGTQKTMQYGARPTLILDNVRTKLLDEESASQVSSLLQSINRRSWIETSNPINFPQVVSKGSKPDSSKYLLQRVIRQENNKLYQYIRSNGVVIKREVESIKVLGDLKSSGLEAKYGETFVEVESMPDDGIVGTYAQEGLLIDKRISPVSFSPKEIRKKLRQIGTKEDYQLLTPIEFVNFINNSYNYGITNNSLNQIYDKVYRYNQRLGYEAVTVVNENGTYRVETTYQDTVKTPSFSSDTIDLLNRLSNKFGIPYKLDTDMLYKGKYYNGVVYVNPNLLTEDTPFHEFAHPFIASVKRMNRSLYNNLVKELKAEGKILKRVDKTYRKFFTDKGLTGRELENAILEEAIVQAVGEYAADASKLLNNSPKLLNVIKKFLDYIKDVLKSIYNKPSINVDEIPINTTLEELAILFNSDINISAKVNREVLDVLNQIDKC